MRIRNTGKKEAYGTGTRSGKNKGRFIYVFGMLANLVVTALFLLVYMVSVAPKLAMVGISGFLFIGGIVAVLTLKVTKIWNQRLITCHCPMLKTDSIHCLWSHKKFFLSLTFR